LHLVGCFYWFILRCTDPWVINLEVLPTVLFRVFQMLSLTKLLLLSLKVLPVPGFLYIFCCFHKEIQCVFCISLLVVRITFRLSDNTKVVQKVLGFRVRNLPQQRDNWSWFTKLHPAAILRSVLICFVVENR
jgi:hypothetical protein